MRLREYLAVLRARWLILVSCVVVFVIAAGVLSLRQEKVYQARASVFFSVSVGQSSGELARGFSYAQGLVSSYAQVAKQPLVLNPVIQQLGLDATPSQLARSITANAPLDTVIIEISVQGPEPEQVADVANAVANQLPAAVAQTLPRSTTNASPVRVTVLSPASVPGAPISPRIPLNLTLAVLFGLAGGVLLAFSRDVLDARVGSYRDVARITDAPVIGAISKPGGGGLRQRLALRRRASQEQAKELRTNFQHLREARRLRSVVFTSAHEDAATALTVASLGLELAHAGVRTVLVDGDVRKPSLSLRYTDEGAPGLSTVFSGEAEWRDVVIKHPGNLPLFILPAGPLLLEPSVMLQRERISRLVAELAAEYEVVLIKAPPVLRVAEGLLLSRLSDGAVVVADEPAMTRAALADEVRALEVANASVLGVILLT